MGQRTGSAAGSGLCKAGHVDMKHLNMAPALHYIVALPYVRYVNQMALQSSVQQCYPTKVL